MDWKPAAAIGGLGLAGLGVWYWWSRTQSVAAARAAAAARVSAGQQSSASAGQQSQASAGQQAPASTPHAGATVSGSILAMAQVSQQSSSPSAGLRAAFAIWVPLFLAYARAQWWLDDDNQSKLPGWAGGPSDDDKARDTRTRDNAENALRGKFPIAAPNKLEAKLNVPGRPAGHDRAQTSVTLDATTIDYLFWMTATQLIAKYRPEWDGDRLNFDSDSLLAAFLSTATQAQFDDAFATACQHGAANLPSISYMSVTSIIEVGLVIVASVVVVAVSLGTAGGIVSSTAGNLITNIAGATEKTVTLAQKAGVK